MTRNLARDLGPLGVRINAVAPPLTDTDMGRWAMDEAGSPRAGLGSGQRAADPGEVAEVIALFCSPPMSYVCGETLYMGGGFEKPPPHPVPVAGMRERPVGSEMGIGARARARALRDDRPR